MGPVNGRTSRAMLNSSMGAYIQPKGREKSLPECYSSLLPRAKKSLPECYSSLLPRECAFGSVSSMVQLDSASHQEPESQTDPLLQLVSLQKASGCWELNAALAAVFGKKGDEVANYSPAQVDGSVWATVLALIWLYARRSDDQVEWQLVAMKAASWIHSQKPDGLSQCVRNGNVLLGCHVTEDTLGI